MRAGVGSRRVRDSWVSLSVGIAAVALSVGLVHCPLLEILPVVRGRHHCQPC